MRTTIDYYNEKAKEFVAGTVNVEFHHMQEQFLKLLPEHALILDFGCGSGRDTKYFLEQGFQVEAVDGSKELCKIASEYTGISVKHALFQELNEFEKYDGLWACGCRMLRHWPHAVGNAWGTQRAECSSSFFGRKAGCRRA